MEVKRPTIAEEWAKYESDVCAAKPEAWTVLDARDAFYAGAATLAGIIVANMSAGPGMTPADDDLVVLLIDELRAYATGRKVH